MPEGMVEAGRATAERDAPPAWLRPVGIVCHFPPPPGGMQAQAQAYLDGLRREGIRTIAIRTNLGAGALAQRLDSVRFLGSLLRLAVFPIRLLRALPRVGILHVMACCDLAFLLFTTPSVLLGKLFRRRVVMQFQDGRAREFFRRWRRFARMVASRADRIQVESEYLRGVFREELGLDARVVPNLCDLDRFRYVARAPLRPVFLVARHLQPLYNVACVIRAVGIVRQRHPEASLLVLGSGPEEAALRRLTAELGLQDAVSFLGYIDSALMPGIYDRASIALNASNADNSPNAILEAFAAGLPVVTTCAGGIPYLVENGRTGFLVELNDHEAMAARALELLEDPGLARRLAGAAREFVMRHAWQRVFPEALKTYGEKEDA